VFIVSFIYLFLLFFYRKVTALRFAQKEWSVTWFRTSAVVTVNYKCIALLRYLR